MLKHALRRTTEIDGESKSIVYVVQYLYFKYDNGTPPECPHQDSFQKAV